MATQHTGLRKISIYLFMTCDDLTVRVQVVGDTTHWTNQYLPVHDLTVRIQVVGDTTHWTKEDQYLPVHDLR